MLLESQLRRFQVHRLTALEVAARRRVPLRVELDLGLARTGEVPGRVVFRALRAQHVVAVAAWAEELHLHIFQHRRAALLQSDRPRCVDGKNTAAFV